MLSNLQVVIVSAFLLLMLTNVVLGVFTLIRTRNVKVALFSFCCALAIGVMLADELNTYI